MNSPYSHVFYSKRSLKESSILFVLRVAVLSATITRNEISVSVYFSYVTNLFVFDLACFPIYQQSIYIQHNTYTLLLTTCIKIPYNIIYVIKKSLRTQWTRHLINKENPLGGIHFKITYYSYKSYTIALENSRASFS